jgi:hypothetical protein
MDFFKGIEHDARAVLNAAQQQTRKYERDPSKKVETFKPDYARFKAVIYFRNGQNRYFYSYDTVNSQDGSFLDEYVGLTKLLRLILNKKGEYKNAVIYAQVDEIPHTKNNFCYQVAKFDYYGNFKENKYLAFEPINGNLKLDIAKLKVGSKTIEK